MRKITVFIAVIFSGFLFLQTPPASAAYRHKTSYINGYAITGANVLNVTFHADGYSTATSGGVTNMYFTDWAWWPNTVSNRNTWKSSIPNGQRANGTVQIGVGINSPWGSRQSLGWPTIFQSRFLIYHFNTAKVMNTII